MKAFAVWLAAALSAFSALGAGYHAYRVDHPTRVLVVVDSSFAMQPAWSRVAGVLEEIERTRYAQFSLFTEKGRVHSWAAWLNPGKVSPYAPRDFSRLEHVLESVEYAQSAQRIVVTNAQEGSLQPFSGWTIRHLE